MEEPGLGLSIQNILFRKGSPMECYFRRMPMIKNYLTDCGCITKVIRNKESIRINSSTITRNVDNLLSGFYFLRIFKQGELFETIKFKK